jgi:hypothetical protein
MVAGGINTIGVTNIVEIIDIESTRSSCSLFPSLPMNSYGSKGYFGFNENALICGGYLGGHGYYM